MPVRRSAACPEGGSRPGSASYGAYADGLVHPEAVDREQRAPLYCPTVAGGTARVAHGADRPARRRAVLTPSRVEAAEDGKYAAGGVRRAAFNRAQCRVGDAAGATSPTPPRASPAPWLYGRR